MICIYAIFNIIDDKCYVGQTIDHDFRSREHKKQLRGFYHHSLYLQRAWCKYGEENFIFVILEILNDKNKLNEREMYWCEKLKPEYNIAPAGGSMRGYKHTEEARKNMSEAHIGKKHHSEEEKQRRSERMKGNKYNTGRKQSPEEIENRAKHHRGKLVSIETRAKMSASLKGRIISDEHKKKLSIAHTGKQLSNEHKRKLSEAALRQWNNPLTIFKI